MLSSSYHMYRTKIRSSKLANRKKKRRSVKIMRPGTNKLLTFEKVTMTGTGCWKIWNKYRGGAPLTLRNVVEYEPGWRIRAIELMTSCI